VVQRPEYLTVPEVMARLRLGRTTVYQQARLYLATGGAEGIPCRRFGRSLRSPAAALETADAEGAAADGQARVIEIVRARRAERESLAPRRSTRRTGRATGKTDQATLPFTD
jgi:hypothetical protein